MRPKILSKRALLIVVPSGFVLFAALLLNFIPKNSTQGSSVLLIENVAALSEQGSSASLIENITDFSKQEQAHSDLPLRLKIPKIKVDAPIEYVGLAPDGAMDVPKGPAGVAWFNLGLRPGENGNAVMAGHKGWKNNIPAVFDNLHKLRVGDKITVEDEKGVTTTFVVREMRIYDKDESAHDVFSSSDGKAHLNLITCAGTWNKTEKTRSERLVIFTDKEI